MGKKDAKGLAGLYAEDCQVMPPGYQTVHGREGEYNQCCQNFRAPNSDIFCFVLFFARGKRF